MVLQLSRSLLQAEWTVLSPNVIPLTAQEGPGQPVSEHEMGDGLQNEDRGTMGWNKVTQLLLS